MNTLVFVDALIQEYKLSRRKKLLLIAKCPTVSGWSASARIVSASSGLTLHKGDMGCLAEFHVVPSCPHA